MRDIETLEECVDLACCNQKQAQKHLAHLRQLRLEAELGRRFIWLANNPKHHIGTLPLFAAECCKLIAEYETEKVDAH